MHGGNLEDRNFEILREMGIQHLTETITKIPINTGLHEEVSISARRLNAMVAKSKFRSISPELIQRRLFQNQLIFRRLQVQRNQWSFSRT